MRPVEIECDSASEVLMHLMGKAHRKAASQDRGWLMRFWGTCGACHKQPPSLGRCASRALGYSGQAHRAHRPIAHQPQQNSATVAPSLADSKMGRAVMRRPFVLC